MEQSGGYGLDLVDTIRAGKAPGGIGDPEDMS